MNLNNYIRDIADFPKKGIIFKDITPLLSAKVEGQDKWHPVLWARNFSNGRIVYDALGHNAKSLNHPEHAKIIRRSANWAIGNLN